MKSTSRNKSDAPKTGTIKQSVILPGAVATVYQLLTDPELHAEFTGAPAHGKARIGGTFSAYDGYITATYRELEKDKRIVQDWSTSEWPGGAPPSRLEITLSPDAKGTCLTLVQTGVPADDVKRYRDGWKEFYWEPLKNYLTHREWSGPRRRTGRPAEAGR